MIHYITLIYNQAPETLDVYQLAMVEGSEELEKLKKAHGKFGNTVGHDEETEDILNNWLPNWIAEQKDELIYSDTENCDYPIANILSGHLIVTGFIL